MAILWGTVFHYNTLHEYASPLFPSSFAVVLDKSHHRSLLLAWSWELCGSDTQTVPVAEEEDLRGLAGGVGVWLDPLAPSLAVPHGTQETKWAVLGIRTVVTSHDWLDGLSRLIGVVEWNGRDVVVEDVGLDDTVEEVAANEAELTVDGRSGTSGEGPRIAAVVRKRGISVLEVSDGD